MEQLKRIAAVHDISGLGKCSLTVALPVISASGVECSCLPTALLSTHTGEFTDFTFRDLSDELLAIAKHWHSTGAVFDGIYSGYLASAGQVALLETVIDTLASEHTKIIVDPVMADNGKYYSKLGDSMCHAFRRLCGRADIITPNVTEATLLAGMDYHPGPHSEEFLLELFARLSDITNGIIAVTGVMPDAEHVGVSAFDARSGKRSSSYRDNAPGVFYGTGDIFASAFSALTVRGVSMEKALDTAVSLVGSSIARTVENSSPRRFGVDFEGALPDYIQAVSHLLGK